MDGTKEAGLNRVQWNLAPNAVAGFGRGGAGGAAGGRAGRGGRGVPFVPTNATTSAVEPGTYVVKLAVGGKELMTTVQVDADDIH